MRALLLFVLLAGCATPQTILIHPKTGQQVSCGGSRKGAVLGGVVGYHIQESQTQDCVARYQAQGYQAQP